MYIVYSMLKNSLNKKKPCTTAGTGQSLINGYLQPITRKCHLHVTCTPNILIHIGLKILNYIGNFMEIIFHFREKQSVKARVVS